MKKIHKILIITVTVIALVVVGLLPSGVAFADQTCKTNKVSFYSLDEDNYPLKNGFVISTHMNGPVYFEKKEFQLHGAKPDAQFVLYREFTIDVYSPVLNTVVILAGTQLPAEGSIWTDKHGNGHVITNQPPSNMQLLKNLGIDYLTFKNLLFEVGGGGELIPAYESEILTTYIDFKWTP